MIRKLTGQKAVCAALALIISASVFSASAAQTGPIVVKYEELEKLVRTQAPSYLIAAENFGATGDAVQQALDAIPDADAKYYKRMSDLEGYEQQFKTETDPVIIASLELKIASAQADIAMYQRTIDSSYQFLITESDNNDTKERNLRTSLTSATASAKQLFFGLKALDENLAIARLSLDTLNAKLPGMNVKFDLGLVSKSQLDDFKDGIESAQTAISNLETKRRSTETNLRLFLGIKLTDAVELGALPEIDLSKINSLQMADKDKYVTNSSLVVDAKKRLADTEPGKQGHTNTGYAIAKITLSQTTDNAAASFENDYQSLKDGYRDFLKKDEDNKKLEKDVADLELKYSRGIASKRQLEDKKADLKKAVLENEAARLDLCSKLVAYQDKLAAIWKASAQMS